MQEALDLAATPGTRFDLLLTDIRLPDGNGWELLRRAGEGGYATPGSYSHKCVEQ